MLSAEVLTLQLQSITHAIGSPTTRFATKKTDAGLPSISSIQWKQVLDLEPENVVHWIRYMHVYKISSISDLLRDLSHVMGNGSKRPPRWAIYIKTGIPSLLIDVFCSSGKFIGDPEVSEVCTTIDSFAMFGSR